MQIDQVNKEVAESIGLGKPVGALVRGVESGSPAEKAGLQAGDILLQLGEYKFVDVKSYGEVLSKFNKGDKAKLRIKRGNVEKEFDIVF